MAKVSVDNQQIYYATNRVKSDTVVLLLHGAGGRHQDWPVEIRRIKSCLVVAPDLPGHKRSDLPGRDSIEGYADFADRFVTALGYKKVIVIGHSMGGAIAQQIGIRQPDWLAGLVLVGTGANMPVAPNILDNALTDMPTVADFVTKYAWGRNTEGLLRGMGRKLLLENEPEVFYGDYKACNDFDARNQLGQISAPTLIISSKKDKFMPLKKSQFLHEQIPNSEIEVLEAAGHMMMLEQPNEVARLVSDFIKKV